MRKRDGERLWKRKKRKENGYGYKNNGVKQRRKDKNGKK